MVKIKKLVPVAAKISAGKSKLLNTLLNIKFLECKAGIATKFINILRYNPNIKKPLFYHLKVKGLGDKYEFYKDLSEEIYEGEEKIIEANKAVNKKFFNETNIDYEDLFYMTEINTEPFIQDKDYLKNHDLCDIPGLSEYQENQNNDQKMDNWKNEEKKDNIIEDKDNEENLLNSKAKEIGLNIDVKKKEIKKFNEKKIYEKTKEKEEEKEDSKPEDDIYYDFLENNNDNKTYLTEIFKIIKDYIDGAIIILSVDNYKSIDNYHIIAQLHHVIQKQITNFLIILNKMDLSKNQEKDIGECKGMFAKYFPKFKTFNINLNTFIPISVNKLKSELLMNRDFRSLIYCHFYNFMENLNNYKAANRDIGDLSFISHLKNIINKILGIKENQDIKNAVIELNNSTDISKINNEIATTMKDLEYEFKNKGINLGFSEEDFIDNDNSTDIDDEELNPSFILKFFYKEKDSLTPYISEESNNLLDYFKNNKPHSNLISFQTEKEEHNEKNSINKSIIKKLKNISNSIETKSKLDKKKIGNILENLKSAIDFLDIYNVIFIPFIGENGSGKSSIINGIIGEDVLPTGDNECTKRGIVIRYLRKKEKEINIRKTYFKEKQLDGQINYYIEPEDYIIGKGLDQVRGILNDLNYNYNEKERDAFYYIRTNIKLFDDLGLDDSLKRMIYLIDLPGFGTENKFEKNIYLKLMSFSNCFIFTVKNSVIKEKKTQEILKKIFVETKERKGILTTKLLESSLFVLNCFNEQKIEDNDIEQTKKDILKLIKGFTSEEKEKIDDVNLCFFHAKNYANYCNDYNYFFNIKNSIKFEYKNFTKKNRDIFISPENKNTKKYKSFGRYLLAQLKTNMPKLSKKSEKNVNKEIENELNEIIKILNINIKEDSSSKICQQFALGQENIINLNSLKDSNFEELKSKTKSQIKTLNINIQEDIKRKIDNIIGKLDSFFSNDFSKEKDFKTIEIFKNRINEIKAKLLKIYTESQTKYTNIIYEYQNKIKDSLLQKKDNIKNMLKENNFKRIKQEIDQEIKSNLEDLNGKIKEFLESIYTDTDDINNQIDKAINEFSSKIRTPNHQSFKDYFSLRIGSKKGDLTKEIIDEIKIASLSLDKIHEEKGFKEWIKSFFSKINFFNNCVDIIINSFVKKMEYILVLLIEELTRYIENAYKDIESTYEISTEIYTDEQQNILNIIKNEYEEQKFGIEKFKDQLMGKNES